MPDALELNVTTTTDATTLANTIFGDGIQVVSATLTGAATLDGRQMYAYLIYSVLSGKPLNEHSSIALK